jgi:hypothetical protein
MDEDVGSGGVEPVAQPAEVAVCGELREEVQGLRMTVGVADERVGGSAVQAVAGRAVGGEQSQSVSATPHRNDHVHTGNARIPHRGFRP